MSDMPEGATRRRHPDDRMRSDPEGAGPSLDRGTMDDHIGNVPKPSNRGADQLLLGRFVRRNLKMTKSKGSFNIAGQRDVRPPSASTETGSAFGFGPVVLVEVPAAAS